MNTVLAQLENRALGDIDDMLALHACLRAGKGDLVGVLNQLANPSVRLNPQGAVTRLETGNGTLRVKSHGRIRKLV